MALIVKSLRAKSSKISVPKVTSSGLLPSMYFPSLRSVVTSQERFFSLSANNPSSGKTITVPKCSPTGIVRENNSEISCGFRLVAMSISVGFRLEIESRTHPPTIQAFPD